MKLQRPGEAPTRVLVLETGEEDLKKYLARSGAVREKDLRSVLSSITLALQTLHSAGLVWTDLKVEVRSGEERKTSVGARSEAKKRCNPGRLASLVANTILTSS